MHAWLVEISNFCFFHVLYRPLNWAKKHYLSAPYTWHTQQIACNFFFAIRWHLPIKFLFFFCMMCRPLNWDKKDFFIYIPLCTSSHTHVILLPSRHGTFANISCDMDLLEKKWHVLSSKYLVDLIIHMRWVSCNIFFFLTWHGRVVTCFS